MNIKNTRVKRQERTRKKIGVVAKRFRLSVFRSSKYCYAQIIDMSGNTVLGLSEKALSEDKKVSEKSAPLERAKQLGIEIAKMAKSKKINEVVFDKGRFSYHGKVKAVADGAREGGLQF